MSILRVLTSILVFGSALPALGQSPSGVSHQLWSNERINARLHEIAESSLTDDQLQALTEDLSELAKVKGQGGSELHQKLFGGPVDGQTYLDFIFSNVEQIGPLPKRSHAGARAEKASSGNHFKKTIRLSIYFWQHLKIDPMFFGVGSQADMRAWRWTMWIHEVRHLQGFYHVKCVPSPVSRQELVMADVKNYSPYSSVTVVEADHHNSMDVDGGPECDDQVLSAHGSEIVFAGNISRFCKSCSFAMKNALEHQVPLSMNFILNPDIRNSLKLDIIEPKERFEMALAEALRPDGSHSPFEESLKTGIAIAHPELIIEVTKAGDPELLKEFIQAGGNPDFQGDPFDPLTAAMERALVKDDTRCLDYLMTLGLKPSRWDIGWMKRALNDPFFQNGKYVETLRRMRIYVEASPR